MHPLFQAQLAASGTVYLENAAGDTAIISLYGGHVVSWSTAQDGEQLYCSTTTSMANNQPIRGGIPVCFPQFSGMGTLPKHGFVRTMPWQCDGDVVSGKDVAAAHVRLSIGDNAHSRKIWDHGFLLHLDVTMADGALEVVLQVQNTGATAFSFTGALHTYFSVDDVRQASVSALSGQVCIDTTQQPVARYVQEVSALHFPGEVDNIYPDAPNTLMLTRPGRAALGIAQRGFTDAVIWNPGPLKAAQLTDMPDDGWLHMVCIEAAQTQQAVTLPPQGQWTGAQQLTVMLASQ